MFYFKKNEEQQEHLAKIFRKVKVMYGNIPPQMELLGNIEVEYLEDFLKTLLRVIKHPNIDPDLFGFLRLHVAFKEDYPYCKNFNTKLLASRGYNNEQLQNAIDNISDIPFDEKHQVLAHFALKAVYQSKLFNQDDFETLYDLGWSQKDVFDAIEHTGTILRNGRILTAYSQKDLI